MHRFGSVIVRHLPMVALGVAAVFSAGIANWRASDTASGPSILIRSESGRPLASFFGGLDRPVRPVSKAQVKTERVDCASPPKGLYNWLKARFAIQSVSASTCTPGPCGGSRLESYIITCDYQCHSTDKEQFRYKWYMPFDFGWKFNGLKVCGACEDCAKEQCDTSLP